MSYKTSTIDSLEALQREQFIVRERLKSKEGALRNRVHQIPAELAAAGANSFIPKIFRGKVTNAALNGGKSLINRYFAPDDDRPGQNLINGTVKQAGLLTKGLKLAFKLFKR